MDSSVSQKEEIWFLRVCHHISNAVYSEYFLLSQRNPVRKNPQVLVLCTFEEPKDTTSCLSTIYAIQLWRTQHHHTGVQCCVGNGTLELQTHKTARCADSMDRQVPACLHIDSSPLTAVTNPIQFPSSGRLSQQTLEDWTTAASQPKVPGKLHGSRLLDGISDWRLYFQSAAMNWFCMEQGTSVTRYTSQTVSKYSANTKRQYIHKLLCYQCSNLQ